MQIARLGLPLLGLLTLTGCPTVIRRAGQTELLVLNPENNQFIAPQDHLKYKLPWIETRNRVPPQFGDRVRYSSDTLLIRVESAYIAHKPPTLTQSSDVLLFAEVWENASAGPSDKPLTYVLYSARDQLVPGRMNFTGAIAYGPTFFKGHPLRIKFTLMILQKEKGKQQGSVADIVSKYTATIPGTGAFLSPAAGVIRDVLRAQPDVIAFDYETVLISDKPEALLPPITHLPVTDSGGKTETGGTKTASVPTDPKKSPDENLKDASKTLDDAQKLEEAAQKIAEAAKKQQAVNDMNQRTLWANWQRSFGWLQYGQYAIVETARERGPEPSTPSNIGKPGLPRPPVSSITEPAPDPARTYDRINDKPLITRAGWILAPSSKSGQDSVPGTNDLAASYLIFTVVPGLIAEEAGTLRDASAASERLITSLSQTQENVNTALASIDQTAKDLKYAVLKNRAESLADRLSKTPDIDYTTFKARFAAGYDELVNSFAPLQKDIPENERTAIRKTIETRYQEIFRDINKDNTPSDTAKNFTVTAKPLADLLTSLPAQIEDAKKRLDDANASRDKATISNEVIATLKERSDALQTAVAAMKDAKDAAAAKVAETGLDAAIKNANEEAENAKTAATAAMEAWKEAAAGHAKVMPALVGLDNALKAATTQEDTLREEANTQSEALGNRAKAAGTEAQFKELEKDANAAANFKKDFGAAAEKLKKLRDDYAVEKAKAADLQDRLAPSAQWARLNDHARNAEALATAAKAAKR